MSDFTEQHVRALCLLSGIEPRSIFQMENQYWPEAYMEERKRSPWFVVTTSAGAIRMGWRKRVLSISWSDTTVRKVITDDDTTKDAEMVHAWTYSKAVEYLSALRKAIRDIAAAPSAGQTLPAETSENVKGHTADSFAPCAGGRVVTTLAARTIRFCRFAVKEPPMNSPIASPAPTDDLLERSHDLLHRIVSVFIPGNDGAYTETTALMAEIRAALAQLGTGSGAGAQSDSGADSGHFSRAVQSEGSTARDAERERQLDALEMHMAYRLAVHHQVLAYRLMRKDPHDPEAAQEFETAGEVILHFHDVKVRRFREALGMAAALAPVEGKEKTR